MSKHRDELKGKQFGAAAPIMKGCVEEWKELEEERKESYKKLAQACRYDEEENTWDCEPQTLNED